MGNKIQTFDPTNIDSITQFANEVCKWNSNEVSEEFLLLNVKKGIDALKQINKNDYDTERTKELLRLIGNISSFCRSTESIDVIIKEDLHPTLREIIVYQLINNKINYDLVDSVYITLTNVTDASFKMANSSSTRLKHTSQYQTLLNSRLSSVKLNSILYKLLNVFGTLIADTIFTKDAIDL